MSHAKKISRTHLTRQDLINSELGGIAVGNNDQCFRLVDLKRMFNNTIHMEMESGVPFFITIDPCAGGEHSDFAIVSFVVSHGVYQVLGAEALQTKVSLFLYSCDFLFLLRVSDFFLFRIPSKHLPSWRNTLPRCGVSTTASPSASAGSSSSVIWGILCIVSVTFLRTHTR